MSAKEYIEVTPVMAGLSRQLFDTAGFIRSVAIALKDHDLITGGQEITVMFTGYLLVEGVTKGALRGRALENIFFHIR